MLGKCLLANLSLAKCLLVEISVRGLPFNQNVCRPNVFRPEDVEHSTIENEREVEAYLVDKRTVDATYSLNKRLTAEKNNFSNI